MNTKILHVLGESIYYIALICTLLFAICFVSLSGVSVRPVLEMENVDTMMLISKCAAGMLACAAICAVSRISYWAGKTAE